MRQSRSGFTLIELIFVIVIIGLLAAVAVPRFLTTEQNAKIKPALEIAKQVVNKCEERYQEIQDAYVSHAVKQDQHIMQYLSELTTNVDKHFQWDTNETVFEISYNPDKLTTGNDVGTDDDKIEDDSNGTVCVRVTRKSINVPVTVDANTTQFDYNVSKIDVSCITAAH